MRKIFILQVSSKAKIIMSKCIHSGYFKPLNSFANKDSFANCQAMAVTNIVVNIISTKRGMSEL